MLLYELVEDAVGKEPRYYSQKVDTAINILNTYCKNALWMLYENKPIYRGDSVYLFNSAFACVDTTKTLRKSTNTTNYYTIILDNIPSRAGFPKRSRSFIATTDSDYANDYRHDAPDWRDKDAGLYILVPFDKTKIGVVNASDMWHTQIKLFGRSDSIEELNRCFRDMGYLDLLRVTPQMAEDL